MGLREDVSSNMKPMRKSEARMIKFLYRNRGGPLCPSSSDCLEESVGQGGLHYLSPVKIPNVPENKQIIFAVPDAPAYYNAWSHRGMVVHVLLVSQDALVLARDGHGTSLWCRAQEALAILDAWPRTRYEERSQRVIPSPAYSRLEVVIPFSFILASSVQDAPSYTVPERCIACGMELVNGPICPTAHLHQPSPGPCPRCESSLIMTTSFHVRCIICERADAATSSAIIPSSPPYRNFCDYCGGWDELESVEGRRGMYCPDCRARQGRDVVCRLAREVRCAQEFGADQPASVRDAD